ncbi:nitrogen fixation protein FixH [Pelomonas cellulosilytica]|uniref:Nitrogen fixation protein FixH n=1 Tax=Pelomonas cellulosilytica TaxID=2906762 RepID=A0ABS8XQY8_9BURK|nr:nitrogen fixation protein FixH [Pelomonas sp. P8]MCE4553578.1 nitrogen fixation protein FixH [Pelomonas sp. P8]
MVWLVVGGPAAVVVASFFTLALAIRNPDPPLDLHATAQRSADDVEPADVRARSGDMPAMLGRNHAATGVPGTRP